MSNPQYLREVQYRDSSNLEARANLHARYSTAPMPWFSWVARQVEWPRTGRILEVGCGPGWFWEHARAELPSDATVTLTDLSSGMVREASARVSPRYDAVHAAVADAASLPFVDASFDVALANHMLYHVPDPSSAVRELVRVLGSGGTVVAATNGPQHLREVDEITADVFGERAQRKYSDRFGAHNGAGIVAPHVEQVEWRPYDDDLLCTDPDDVLAYVLSYPPGDGAAPGMRERLRAAIADRFASGGGTLRVTRESGVFVGRVA